jgi:hypothetical protein
MIRASNKLNKIKKVLNINRNKEFILRRGRRKGSLGVDILPK